MNKEKHCYICGSTAVSIYRIINNFPVYRCKKCGLKWVNDVSAEKIISFYNEKYFNSNSKMGYKNYLANEENHRRNARSILRIVDEIRTLTELRILDVGCAFGFLLDEARRFKHCNVYGVEFSRYAYEYAKNKLGLNILNCELNSSNFDTEFFDVVFLIGTIEHLIYPKEAIAIINRILKPGGLIVITTLDTTSLFPLYSIKPPEHLFYFNHNNLLLFLNNLGFEVLLKKTYFAYYCLHDLFHGVGKFLSLSILGFISGVIRKKFPNFYVKIPTNEMILIGKKVDIL